MMHTAFTQSADECIAKCADPLYKTSDSREAEILERKTYADKKQQKLPSYKNMFSALPDRYPSFSLR
jgi:hypothetical protein